MTIQYNQYEQRKIDEVEALEAAARRGAYVNPYALEAARKEADLAKHNAACRAERIASLAAQAEEKRKAEEKARQHEIQQQIATFKQQARARFIGTPEQFEYEWPTILSEWQRRRALDDAADDPSLQETRDWLRRNINYGRL